MAKFMCEDVVEFESEDGGQALVATLTAEDNSGTALFARFQSWDEACKHLEAEAFRGKRVRVTIETLDEEVRPSEKPPKVTATAAAKANAKAGKKGGKASTKKVKVKG